MWLTSVTPCAYTWLHHVLTSVTDCLHLLHHLMTPVASLTLLGNMTRYVRTGVLQPQHPVHLPLPPALPTSHPAHLPEESFYHHHHKPSSATAHTTSKARAHGALPHMQRPGEVTWQQGHEQVTRGFTHLAVNSVKDVQKEALGGRNKL